ncbi:hypothetical protein SAMN02745830_04084 [Streptomyces sp. Amel2xC10]|nr:hypothetical protein SAMN02745830_04084 [Streptomyces sp. Amel2xC10]
MDIRIFGDGLIKDGISKDGGLLVHASALRSVYADAFYAPPWTEAAERAAEFAGRLTGNVRRPGFGGRSRTPAHGGVAVRRP